MPGRKRVIVEVNMSNLSSKILKEAKIIRKKDKANKLTQIQNELAQKKGFPSFKALLQEEKQKETQKRLEFAKAGCSQSSEHTYPFINNNVEVFVRADGLRGLRALRSFEIGDEIFDDKILINLNLCDAPLAKREGMPWALTQHILVDHPKLVSYMETELKLRESYIPKLDTLDRQIIARIKLQTNLPEAYIIKLYNLVCIYNLRTEGMFHIPDIGILFQNQSCAIALGLCYANHSCSPNAERVTSGENFDFTSTGMYATRKIFEGDEVTWSYFGDCQSRSLKDRQKELLRDFGFHCRCKRCHQERYKIGQYKK